MKASTAHLRNENETNGEGGGKEGEEGSEKVGSVHLVSDHDSRWNSDETQHHHVVHADSLEDR